MSTALVIAGGSGKRTGQEVPKQFLTVNEKPIIIYTLEAFQRHPDVSRIVVVVIDGWQTVVETYARQFGISKLAAVITGGACRFDSIYNGIKYISTYAEPDELVTLHDANRPLVSEKIIKESQRVAALNGNALTVLPCNDSMFVSHDRITASDNADRKVLFSGQTPETFKFSFIKEICDRAAADKAGDLAVCALLLKYGKQVFLSDGDAMNFKITTASDIEIFKAMIAAPERAKRAEK